MGNRVPGGVFAKYGGSWVEPADIQAKHAGTWKDAQAVYINIQDYWGLVWERNSAPGDTSIPTVTYALDGSGGWNATAAWTLPADTDLASVKVRWTFGGSAGSWQTLAASATSHTTAAPSGVTVSVEVYVQDTGGLVSNTKTGSGAYSPLHRVATLSSSQVGLDRITATWTHPSGSTRAGYTVNLYTGAVLSESYYDAASATSRTFTVAPGTAYTVTVIPVDDVARNGAERSTTITPTVTAPGTPTVSSWSYTTISLTWSASSFADSYSVERAIGNGAFVVVANVAGTTYTGAVLQDTNYRFRVRAKGTTYFSAYSGIVYPAIGHAAYTATESYSGSNNSVNLYANSSGTGSLTGAGGVTVPSNATVSQMSVNLSCTFSTSLFCQWSNRDAYYVAGGVVGSLVPQKANPWQQTFAFGAGPGLCGILLVGTGWSWSSTGGFRATGTISVSGTQTVNYPAVSNSYW